ncbi:MAG: type III-A CRISPR-associated protein Cas10/Csm1 [Anaerolineae bacterium]|nr:type III-A CRISPR-associated protein Cas10/Csm1 [Anaerolineae bacterium]
MTPASLSERVWQAALAGLLHDVGKVVQRAQSQPWLAPTDVPAEKQPVHAAWSVRFIGLMPEPYRAITLPGAYHHAPDQSPATDKRMSELVALADKLSAGERADPSENTSKNPPSQLVTIFDRLALQANKPRIENYLPLALLTLERETLFPVPAQNPDTRGKAYDRLRHELEDAVKPSSLDPQTYLENVLAAMQKTTWCVPSAYYHSAPDVSLYDHSRMTAALAACLADWSETSIRDLLGAVERDFRNERQSGDDTLLNQDVALLIGGDISGLQDFIYTITSKQAARTLRGRSFYLQLLGEAMLRFILRELGLPYTNVIYSGGGNFFLLAPISAQQVLPRLRRTITQTLLTHHGAALYLALGYVTVPARGFRRGVFKEYWDAMRREIGIAKQKRYTELGDELYARVFELMPHGGNKEKTCAVCGAEDEKVRTIKEDASEVKICALCDSFADLGSQLTQNDFIVLGFAAPELTERRDAQNALRAFGLQFRFARPKQEITFDSKPERAVIWAFDDWQDEQFPVVRDVPTARMTRYAVNRIPRTTFDELQEEAQGIKRLGVLRMDVDNLGDLFGEGFGKGADNLATLSRIAALSFQLGLFFDGWVKKICAKHADKVYAVYAGGDDVFLIAPWDIVPTDLAQQIAKDFADYTAHNPDVHLSAGMSFIHDKYPVYQAAEDAKEALDQAKAMQGKNAFSFLGQAWHWDEFAQVTAKFERLKNLVSVGGAPEQLLQHLRYLALEEAAKARRLKTKPVWGKWMWRGAYFLTRMAEREKKRNPKVAQELQAIHDELSKNEYREIGQWGVAARWAQLWLRERQ